MRVESRPSFLRDLHRRGVSSDELTELDDWSSLIGSGRPLPVEYREHPLEGAWAGYHECHLSGDWLLIYKRRPGVVVLYRTGTHAELFGAAKRKPKS